MEFQDVFELLDCFQVRLEFYPLRFDDFKTDVVDEIFNVMKHSLGECVSFEEDSVDVQFFHGLLY